MKVFCPICGHKATRYATNKMSDKVQDYYCACSNPACLHTFKMQLAFVQTINPPITPQTHTATP